MITPNDFLNQAERLIIPANNPKEVDFRSAVSRSYYSLFHETFNELSQNHRAILAKVISDDLDNQFVVYDSGRINSLDRNYLKYQHVNLHKTIPIALQRIKKISLGFDFNGFRDDRNDADYEIQNSYSNNEARTKVAEIKKLIRKIQLI